MITIVENYEGSTSWYRKWSNGFIEQGGIYMYSPSTDATTNFTFPVAFEHTALTFKGTWLINGSPTSAGEPGVKNGTLSNTGVSILQDHFAANKIGLYWEAKGF